MGWMLVGSIVALGLVAAAFLYRYFVRRVQNDLKRLRVENERLRLESDQSRSLSREAEEQLQNEVGRLRRENDQLRLQQQQLPPGSSARETQEELGRLRVENERLWAELRDLRGDSAREARLRLEAEFEDFSRRASRYREELQYQFELLRRVRYELERQGEELARGGEQHRAEVEAQFERLRRIRFELERQRHELIGAGDSRHLDELNAQIEHVSRLFELERERLLRTEQSLLVDPEKARLLPPPSNPAQFSAYYPKRLSLGTWTTVLVYAYVPKVVELVKADARQRIGGDLDQYDDAHSEPTPISRGAEIIVVPFIPGCQFNPPKATLLWLEDWHRLEFRVQPLAEREPGASLDGWIAFYVGPILIGVITLSTAVAGSSDGATDVLCNWASTSPYQAIFVSYSHEDASVVNRLEKAYTVLGMSYLRDIRILRSGQQWNATLLKKIEEADIFQLCWSYKAKSSMNVEKEWRHAISQKREHFIRPVFWEQPMPEPPTELEAIHFAYLDW